MEYLVTYYVKNTNSAKDIFNVIPYASSVVTGSENEVLELVASKLKKNPSFVAVASWTTVQVTRKCLKRNSYSIIRISRKMPCNKVQGSGIR
jgi:hypothetical protein